MIFLKARHYNCKSKHDYAMQAPVDGIWETELNVGR